MKCKYRNAHDGTIPSNKMKCIETQIECVTVRQFFQLVGHQRVCLANQPPLL